MIMSCISEFIIVDLYSFEDILYSMQLLITVFCIRSPGKNFSCFDPFNQADMYISFIEFFLSQFCKCSIKFFYGNDILFIFLF